MTRLKKLRDMLCELPRSEEQNKALRKPFKDAEKAEEEIRALRKRLIELERERDEKTALIEDQIARGWPLDEVMIVLERNEVLRKRHLNAAKKWQNSWRHPRGGLIMVDAIARIAVQRLD